MSALPFVITNAGLTALANVGTLGPVTLTTIKIGSSGYTPLATATGLTTVIKSLTPIGSTVPSTGMIHMTFEDASADVYSVKEIGIYAGSTLFAIYANATAFLSKTSGNLALFSIDLALTNATPGSVTIGSATFAYPAATESAQGVAEIATTAEVTTGTDDTRIVTPAKLSYAYVKKTGDTMTGALVLPSDPTANLQASTKQYVDNTTVSLTGDTMTGSLTLSGAPTSSLHAASKAYADGVQSLTANGYQKFPGGLILQWGKVDFGGNVRESMVGPYSFPIAFPNSCLNISLTTLTPEHTGFVGVTGGTNTGGDNVMMISTTQLPTASQFWVWNNCPSGDSDNENRGFYWIAMGN